VELIPGTLAERCRAAQAGIPAFLLLLAMELRSLKEKK
jgi:acyl CoA:acetate/3-ketoacid CoA transferase alpha subunit